VEEGMKIERRDQDKQVRTYGDLKPGDVFEFVNDDSGLDAGVYMLIDVTDGDGDNLAINLETDTSFEYRPESKVTLLKAKLVVEGEA
jgi:hypothetical protein